MAAIIPLDPHHGASVDEWTHFDLVLGLTEDLLPVVSNNKARVSPRSNIKEVGKVPSLYNGDGHVVGMSQWTQHVTTGNEIAQWSRTRDFGICLQTRRVRALDIDIPDAAESDAVRAFIAERYGLPTRSRGNSSKFLVAFELEGAFTKRRFKTAQGVIEFLATGQQFIAVGRHPSGARYEWEGGLPDTFPVLNATEFEALWSALADEFATEEASERPASIKAAKLDAVHENDPIAKHLHEAGMVKRVERDGRLHITCPWEAEHTSDTGDSSTTYWPAHTGGFDNGGFRCLHAHCEHRGVTDLLEAVGLAENIADDFEVIEDTPEDVVARKRFQFVQAAEFGAGKPASWIIKHVLPRAELIVLYGESGAGKSFMALDLMGAIARGAEWRGHKTTEGLRCGYIAAEGAAGFRNRLHAYAQHHEITLPDLPIAVLTGAPSFLEKKDISALAEAMVAYGQIDVLVVDTLAQVTPGANENSSEDMGRAIKHCKLLHEATGATIILIHHSGKDAARGARGWSGLKGALDCELEVARCDDDRVLTISKIKDGPGEGQQYGFKLLDVPLGMDDDGDVYGSCVVEYSEVAVTNKKGGPRGKNERIIYKIFLDMIEVGGGRVAGKAILEQFKVQTPDLRTSKEDRDLRDQVGKRTLGELVKKGFVVKFGEDYGLPKSGGGDEDA